MVFGNGAFTVGLFFFSDAVDVGNVNRAFYSRYHSGRDYKETEDDHKKNANVSRHFFFLFGCKTTILRCRLMLTQY